MAGLRLRFEQHSLHPGTARVWLDDHEITHGLTELGVKWSAEDVTVADLTIKLDDLEMDALTLAVLTAYMKERKAQ